MTTDNQTNEQPALYANCKFQICDLPGQCKGEGRCHHPATLSYQDKMREGREPQAQAESCKLGCTESCAAKEHGCASECPALPWQPQAQAGEPEVVAWEVTFVDGEGRLHVMWYPHSVHPDSNLAKKLRYTQEALITLQAHREAMAMQYEHLITCQNDVANNARHWMDKARELEQASAKKDEALKTCVEVLKRGIYATISERDAAITKAQEALK